MFFQGNEKYNCATYLRLSRSDGDQQESNSIKNQRALLNDYMGKHPELHKFDEYVDDGYSGTNFERPDFKRMMQDIEKRNVNCMQMQRLRLRRVNLRQVPLRISLAKRLLFAWNPAVVIRSLQSHWQQRIFTMN